MQRLRLCVGWTCVVFLASCANVGGQSAEESGAATSAPVQMATPSVPVLPGGESSDLNEAATKLSFSILVPDAGPATPETLTNVWLDQVDDSVALEYSGGDVDIVESPAAYKDAKAYFNGIIQDGGAKETLTSVQGYPALAIEGKTDAFSSNPSWLEIDFNGVDVNITSSVYSIAVLTEVGGSLGEA